MPLLRVVQNTRAYSTSSDLSGQDVLGAAALNGLGTLTLSGGGTGTDALSIIGNISLTAGANISSGAGGTSGPLTIATLPGSGVVTVTSPGSITLSGAGGSGGSAVVATTGSAVFTSPLTTLTGSVSGLGTLTVSGGSTGTVTTNGNVNLTAGANISGGSGGLAGTSTIATPPGSGVVTVTSPGSITLSGAGGSGSSAVVATTGGATSAPPLVTLTGNVLSGSSASEHLLGTTGADRMAGGQGNDYYRLDHAGDVITEMGNQGTDTVESRIASYTLAANVENLVLGLGARQGYGNALDNTLQGNAADNELFGGLGNDRLEGGAGNDHLNGQQGTDTLLGGSGDDHYYLDQPGDLVTENAGEGYDTVYAGFSYTLTAEVERLELSGWSVNGTGNGLDNTLIGSQGNNVLDGGLGADQMQGGKGNDIYVVDNVGDAVIEAANEGMDTVQSRVSSYTLGDNVENLILTGAGINGQGNGLHNTLTGNGLHNLLNGAGGNDKLFGEGGNDLLIGGDGFDVLSGGAGMDEFRFTATQGSDLVTDFQAGADKLVFDATVFTALGLGPLNADMLHTGQWSVAAQDGDDHLLFRQSTGELYYDPDGNGVMAKFLVATLQGVGSLDAGDISVAILPPS